MKKYSYMGTVIAIAAILAFVVLYKFVFKNEKKVIDEDMTFPTYVYEVVPAEFHASPTE